MPIAVPTLAHLTGSELPLPTWLLAYGTGLRRRARLPRAPVDLGAPPPGARGRGPAAARVRPGSRAARCGIVLRALGVALFALVLAAALFGLDNDVSNLAPYAHITARGSGCSLVSALVGDLWRALDPFPPLATRRSSAGASPRQTARPAPGLWPAVVVVGSYLWIQLAYHSPLSPRAAAVWLVGVSAARLGRRRRSGAGRWLRDDEGFAGFFGLLAAMAPLHRHARLGPARRALAVHRARPRAGPPGAEVLLLVAAGAIAFDGINSTNWWLGRRRRRAHGLVADARLDGRARVLHRRRRRRAGTAQPGGRPA